MPQLDSAALGGIPELTHLCAELTAPVALCTTAGTIVTLSHSLTRLLGPAALARAGVSIEELFAPDDRNSVRALFAGNPAVEAESPVRARLYIAGAEPLPVVLTRYSLDGENNDHLAIRCEPATPAFTGEQLALACAELCAEIMPASTSAALFERVAEKLALFGFGFAATRLTPDHAALVVHYTTIGPRAVEALHQHTQLQINGYTFTPTAREFIEAIDHRQPVFVPAIAPMCEALLPAPAARFCIALINLSGARAIALVPLVLREELMGVLVFWGIHLRAEALPLLDALAKAVAVAIEQIELRSAMRSQIQRLNSLVTTASAGARLASLDEVLRVICAQAQELLAGHAAAVSLPSEGGAELQMVMASGARAPQMIGLRLPIDASLHGRVMRTGIGMYVDDLLVEPGAHMPSRLTIGIRSGVYQPIKHQSELLGVLFVGHHEPRHFGQADLDYLALYAEHAAVAIANARLHTALRQSEQRYRMLIEYAAEVVISIAPDGTIRELNRAAQQLIGYASHEIVGTSLFDLFDPATAADSWRWLERQVRREPVEMPHMIGVCHRDGHCVTLEATGQVLWQNDRPWAIEIIARDITRRLALEAEQQRRHSELEALVRISQAVNRSLDIEQTLTKGLAAIHELGLATATAVLLFESSTDELALKAHLHLSHQAIEYLMRLRVNHSALVAAVLRDQVARVLKGPAVEAVVERNPPLSGLYLNQVVILPLIADEQRLGLLCLGHSDEHVFDQHELKLLEAIAAQLAQAVANAQIHQQLQDAAAASVKLYREARDLWNYLNTLVQQTPDILLAIRQDRALYPLNPAQFERVTGYAAEEVRGQPIDRFLSAHTLSELTTYWQAILAGYPQIFEIELHHANGALLTMMVSAVLVSDYGEVFANLKDITAQRQLESQVHQNEKLAAIGRLVAGVAHELNNPLGVVLGVAQLLLLEDLSASARADVERIERASMRASHIVNQLRAFAQPAQMRSQAVDIRDLVETSLANLSSEIRRAQIVVEVDIPQSMARVVGDIEQLEQVILNIMRNAAQSLALNHPEQERRIIVRARPVDVMVQLSITDTGRGIPPEYLARVFEPFFTTLPVGEGIGLGLTIVHSIIQQHGGHAWAESDAHGKTTLNITLPMFRSPARQE